MKINISIDDVSPHPMSSVKVLDRCHELIDKFPSIKFTLFVPMAYWRTVRPEVATKYPLRIDAFPEFCKTLQSLNTDNFELCYHGLFHGVPGKTDNDEFLYVNKQQALEKFNLMFKIASQANCNIKPIFRPPAWRMSPDAFDAAKECGIRTLALSPKEYARQTYAGAENNFPKVVYYNCNPPFDELSYHENSEIVYHACEWDKNYLNVDLTNQLSEWIEKQDNFEFCFIEQL